MDHARTIAMATTLLADGRAEDVADMVTPLLDPVTAPAASTGQILLRGLMARIEVVHRNHVDRAFELLPELDEVSDLCTCVRAETALWRGWGHAHRHETSDETAQALRLLKESQELFTSINDPVGRCWAVLGRAQAYFALDEYALMRQMLDDAEALLGRLHDTQAERWLHELRIPALRFDGRYERAAEHVQALRSIASDWETRRVRGHAAAHAAALHYDRGAAPSTIIDRAETATSLLRQVDHSASYPLLTAYHAHVGALRRCGDWAAAHDLIDTAEAVLADDTIARAHLQTLRARLALLQGQVDEAHTLLDDLLDRAHQLPHGLQRSHVALLYGEILAVQNQFEEAETWIRHAHRNARETGHRGNQLRTRLRLARLAAARGMPDAARSRLDAAQEYDDYYRVLPHAARRFFVEGVVAQADGHSDDARHAYHLARSAAAMTEDRVRDAFLRQLLAELEANAPPSPALAHQPFGCLDAADDRPSEPPLNGSLSDAPASPFDASFSTRLSRAAVSVPLVATTWLQAVDALRPANRWVGLYRVSPDGAASLIDERGPRPNASLAPPPSSDPASKDAVEWASLSDRASDASFYFGVEASTEAPEEDDLMSQLHPWLPVLELALSRASSSPSAPSPPPSTDIDPASAVEGFVAESAEMQAVADEIRRIHPSHSPVLLTGEGGTGKALVARTVHATSERSDGPLETISCAPTQTEEPLEARLFGTVEDDGSQRLGAVHAAEGGTLVVEDIEALPLPLQSSLLRLLETGQAIPAGGTDPEPVDVRVIATTTADLDARVQEGRFRQALRNRLRVISLHVPPLRERRADIPLLARHFLDRLRPDESTLVSITQPAMEALLRYNWPGNVRQLRNELERALVHVKSEPAPTIGLDRLLDTIVEHAQRTGSPQTTEDDLDAILQPDQTLSDVLSRAEKSVIERVLQACDGQITASADVLGLTRQGLYKKMKRLDIDASSFQPSSEPTPIS